MKSIISFQSYRKFLESFHNETRKNQSSFSIEKYAKSLGIGASNLKMILSGTRNLTNHHALKIARALRMSPIETEYFEALVNFEQSENGWEKTYYRSKLKRQKKMMKTDNLRISNKAFLSDADVPRLLVYLSDTMKSETSVADLDHAKIGKYFGTTPERVRILVTRLEDQGMIERGKDGKIHFVFDKLTNVLAQKNYLKQLMSEAGRRIDFEYEKSDSLYTAFTFSTSDENIQALRADLQSLMEQHMTRVSAAEPNARIAQACFQLFPVSTKLN